MELPSDASTVSIPINKDVAPNDLSTNTVVTGDVENVESNNDDIVLEKNNFSTAIDLIENRVIIILIIIPFSMIGVLTRIGLDKLFTYPGAPVFYLIHPQFVGCVIMGFCLERRELIMESYLPLYTGLTTGLCGSITTFSSWMLMVFLDLMNYNAYSRSGFYNVMAGVADIGITIGMSLIGLKFGRHLADMFIPDQKAPAGLKYRITPTFQTRDLSFLDQMCVIGGLLSTIIVVVLASTIRVNQRILFAMVFAPLGTFARWQLSRFNHFREYFPFGTFYANILGSLILAVLFLLGGGIVYSNVGCEVIAGLMDGFCGCLTTVSSFAAEISTLKRRHAYMYTAVSIVAGQIGMILIVGTYDWTVGLTPTCH